MSKLFENAVASIRMGVEDYSRNEVDRSISAVRNFYAGVLLLAKEVLVRQTKDEKLEAVLGARYKPVPDENGDIAYVQDGVQTIDFNTIAKRFKDFKLTLDASALIDLNRIRNEIEHKFTDQPAEAVQEAIAKAFPVAVDLFRLADEDPNEHLGEHWEKMIETRQLYEAELARCHATTANVNWHTGTIAEAGLRCTECGSHLVEQLDPENVEQDSLQLRCAACTSTLSVEPVVIEAVEEALGGEAFVRAKDSGEDGPIYDCPECACHTFIDFELTCANCGCKYEASACGACGSPLSMDEVLHGDESDLCSYCSHKLDKVMRE